jgi:hypothetical protein
MNINWDSPEEWRSIPYTSYEASSMGGIRRLETGRPVRPWVSNKPGHLKVGLHGKRVWVHRAVALAFHGEPPEGTEVRHLNGDPQDNRPSNLAYGTRSENNYDKRRHGTDHMLNREWCRNGHELAGDNLRIDFKGNRACRECRRATRRRYYERAGR